jgi:ligand-binding sensor domain-containing protein/class 3 adenylate cyclase/predicted metal-dependent HD superfamily phosphohydrolase
MMKRSLFIAACFLLGNVYAQTDYRFRNYTINDGLSQSSVTAIVQDDLNSLWIGTQDGLNRYDGKSFEIFTSDDTEGLESEYIVCAIIDKKGDLWFGTSNGLTHYSQETERFKTYKTKKGTALHVLDITEDEAGNLWLASAESGVYKFDPSKKTFKSFSFLIPSKKTKNVEISAKGKLIVSTEDIGVYICNTHQKKSERIIINKKTNSQLTVNNIIINGRDIAILATNQGAFEVHLETKKVHQKFVDLDNLEGLQNISDVKEQHGIGWIICTNNNGLYVITENGEIVHGVADIFQKSALLFNELNVVYKDGSGTFWIGSQRGLSSFNPLKKGILGVGPSGNPSRGIPTASVWSFDEGPQGKYTFIGTDRAVSRLHNETRKFEQFHRENKSTTPGTGEMAVLAIEAVDANRVIVGCADGLFELTISGASYSYKQIKIQDNSQSHNRVYSIVHWKDDQYWIATKGGALLYSSNTGKVRTFEHNPFRAEYSISKGVCRYVYKDLNDRIWFTTSTGGLNILSQKGGALEIHPYEHNYIIKSATEDYITSIYQIKKREYWLGTSGSGLMRWNEKSKKTELFNKAEGLPNDVIYGIVSGGRQSLWVSTNKGLCNLNLSTGEIKNYTEIDGLMSNEFNLGAFMESKSGIIYFGGIYGYNYFNPKELFSSNEDIGVVFTKFKLENNDWLKPNEEGSPLTNPVYLTNEIHLSYKQRSFTLRFQPSDLSNPELINYKYILEGSEEGEILMGTNNEIHFNSLSHGTYKLKVYARYGDGKWSSSPATMIITVATPYWFTWWFWVLMIVLLAVSVRLFIRARIEASRREQVRLEMKIRDRTKEIQEQNKKIESQNKKIEEEKNKVLSQQKLLQIEKDKTEKLLRNVIPESTAEELKQRGKARARAYKTVSVLFTDFVGFTKISDTMTATELVKKLDVYFTKFDEIIVKNNLEKIKTIGDAYMCAGGVPVRNNTNPIDACLAALQIQSYMSKRKNDAIANDKDYWDLRLGINTGGVTAGVIGSERLAYDIWGATVNQAQRMEMLGEPGKVTVTGATFKHIEPYFECIFLGQAKSKSSGLIDMYVIQRIKPELSMKGEGIFPNERFNQIVNLHHYSSINYYKAERHIMKVLEQGLSKNLHYHSISHTKDVVSAVERLALLENVTDEGLFLLKSAATYHDAGFVEKYDNNETIGARLADEILPKYGYTEQNIEQIKELIYVTEIPHKPKNQLEEIICDADLDYLGRDDFHEIADKLKRELIENKKIKGDKHWDEIQVSFLKSHRYFTKTAKKTRKKKKEQNLQEVIDRLAKDDY